MAAQLEKLLNFEAPRRQPGQREVAHRMLCMDCFSGYAVGFHLPTLEGIRSIVDAAEDASNGGLATILELGAGQGFTARALKLASPTTTVIATDPFRTHGTEGRKRHHPVEPLDAMAAIAKYATANMCYLFVWPNYDDLWSGEALQRIVEIATPLTHVVHVGDMEPGGFTGSPLFHDLLEEHFELVKTAPTAEWPYREDIVAVYKFKAPANSRVAVPEFEAPTSALPPNSNGWMPVVISGRPFSGPIADYRRELDALVKPSKPAEDASDAELRCYHLTKAAYDLEVASARRRHGMGE